MSDPPEWARDEARALIDAISYRMGPASNRSHDVQTIAAALVKASGRYTEAFVDAAVVKARAEGIEEAKKDAAKFVRECLQEHVEEWVIDLVEQGIRLASPEPK
jgi:hypothetical protein